MDVFDLVAKITLDSSEYTRGLGDAKSKFSNFGASIKKGLGVAAKVSAAAVGAAAAGVAAVVKSSVDSYADYEQLVGGIETLFGAGGRSLEEFAEKTGLTGEEAQKAYGDLMTAQNTVMKNAANAYQTAGLSANQYMETVTGFSASLLQSLGGDTQAAANYANMAVVDMADNANKMGSSMESIQNAYQGFAKQNYTMLDNLKLGYGGTKEEMQRLLDDAGKLTGKKFDLSSYADIVEAIHAIQVEMDIAGTTAEEASKTISGSFNSTKAAWKNLLIAFGSGEGVDKAIGNLVSTATTTVKNVVPVVKKALVGISDFVGEIGPVIIAELPGLVQDLLPGLLSAAVSLVGALIKAIPGILKALWSTIKTLFSTFMDWLRGQNPELAEVFDGVIEAGKQVIKFFKDFKKNCEKIWKSIQKVFSDTWESIKRVTSNAWNSIKSFLSKTWGNIKATATKSWDSIKSAISTAIENAKKAVTSTIDSLKSALSTAWNNIKSTASTVWNSIKTAITGPIDSAKNALSTTVGNIKSALSSAWENVKSTASSAWNGIKSAITTPIEEAKESVSKIWDTIKGFFTGDIKINFKLPKITLGSKHWDTLFGPIDIPWPQISWNKKALDAPWMFSGATLFGAGEAGDEILYGRNSLMKDISEAVKGGGGTRTTINITVNAAPGMDENALADKVARKLQQQLDRRQAVWA